MQDIELLKDIKHMLAKLRTYGQINEKDLPKYRTAMDRAIRAVENQEEQKGIQTTLL